MPCGCYTVGPQRLQLLAGYAVCLDGWLKRVPSESLGGGLLEHAFDERDWVAIAAKVWEGLGPSSPAKVLLVRRLLARLRFWLRAPFGPLKQDDNWRLGYLYVHAMGRYGGWDYFSFENYDPDVAELNGRIRREISHADRWLELIECTWPCAPKVFRYVERIIIAIGGLMRGEDVSPDDLAARTGESLLQIDETYLSSDESRRAFRTAMSALAQFVAEEFPVTGLTRENIDGGFASRLRTALGAPSPERTWLAALLLKRIKLFEDSFKSFHFTRGPQQA